MKPGFLEKHMRDLQLGTGNERRRAAEALARYKVPEAIEVLSEGIHDIFWRVRFSSVQALGNTGDEKAIPPLMTALRDREEAVAGAAAEALLKIGGEIMHPVIDLFKEEDWKLRVLAADILGKLGDRKAVPYLKGRLIDPRREVSRAAARAMRNLGDNCGETVFSILCGDEALNDQLLKNNPDGLDEIFMHFLQDQDWQIRKRAADMLGIIRSRYALRPLINALSDTDGWVRSSASLAIGRIGDGNGIKPLIRTLSDPNPRVRMSGAEALGELKAAEAVDKLIELLQDNLDVKQAVIKALGEIGDPLSSPALAPMLGDSEETIRNMTVEALGKTANPYGVDPILEAMERGKIPVVEAKKALKAIIQANRPLKKIYREVLCTQCLSRFWEFSRRKSLFENYTYYACRVCRGGKYTEGAGLVTAVLDRKMKETMVHDKNNLLMNWFALKTPLDFEVVHIVDADPFDVEEFAMIMRNDNDDYRLQGLEKVKVIIDGECSLPQLKINLLNNVFGPVKIL